MILCDPSNRILCVHTPGSMDSRCGDHCNYFSVGDVVKIIGGSNGRRGDVCEIVKQNKYSPNWEVKFLYSIREDGWTQGWVGTTSKHSGNIELVDNDVKAYLL